MEVRSYNLVAVAVAIIAVIGALMVISTSGNMPDGWIIIMAAQGLLVGLQASAVIVSLVACSLHTKFTASGITAEEARKRLCVWSRARWADQELTQDGITVRFDQFTMARITLTTTGSGTEIKVRTSPTAQGLSIMFLLVVLVPFGGVGTLAIAIRSYDRVLFFDRFELRPETLSWSTDASGPAPAAPPELESNWKLNEALFRLQHLAIGAKAARKEKLEDSVLLATVGTMLLFLLLAVWLLLLVPWWACLAVFLAGIPTAIALVALVRRRINPELAELDRWEEWLRHAVYMSNQQAHDGPVFVSALETAMQASREVPNWIRMRSSSFSIRRPRTALILGGMVILGWFLMVYGGLYSGLGPWLTVADGAAMVVLYIWSRLQMDKEDREKLERWNRRTEELLSRIESKLEGL